MTRKHTVEVGLSLRPADKEEILAAGHADLGAWLQDLWNRLDDVNGYAFLDSSGKAYAIAGIAPHLLNNEGVPWLHFSKRIVDNRLRFGRAIKKMFARESAKYGYVWNHTYARNYEHVGWLVGLGFSIHPPASPWWAKRGFLFFDQEIQPQE